MLIIIGGDNEHESEQTAENGKKTPLTNINTENMNVSEDVKFSFGVTQEDINEYVDNAYLKQNTKDYLKYCDVNDKLINDVAYGMRGMLTL